MDFWQTVLATALGVTLVFGAVVGLIIFFAALLDVFLLSIRLINRSGSALMDRITGMDGYTRERERREEKEDWWKNA